MSVAMMTEVFASSRAKGAARLVLLALADEASSTGEISAYRRSQSWLMQKCNMSRSGIQKSLKDLVDLGELEVTDAGDGHKQASYQIYIAGVTEKAPERTDVSPRGSSGEPPSSRSIPLEPVPSCPTPSDEVVERFARFWSMYPRKEAKLPAERAFKIMMKRNHLTDARRALPLHIQMWAEQKRPREKIPLAASWLNQQRYFDELEVNTHFAAPVPGKHRDAGKIRYRGDNSRFMVGDDGSEIDMPEES